MDFKAWFFVLFSTLCWGIAEIFYKKGSLEKEKYSHLKIAILVGIFMGIYATIILFTQGVDLALFPLNFVLYLPVSLAYIVSMVCSYFGVRYIEESISDPIENSSAAVVVVLCSFILHETYEIPVYVAASVIAVGIILLGIFSHKETKTRGEKIGKKLAIFAIAMPFCYMILDAVGTFLDIYYVDVEDVADSILRGVTEANLEHTANCAYEYTFLLVAIGLYIFIRCKGEKLFDLGEAKEVNQDGTVSEKKWYLKVLDQKWKILAAIFETGGQATYIFALSNGAGIAALILNAGTVVVSLILSRIFLKEKLSWKQYLAILVIMIGILTIGYLDA